MCRAWDDRPRPRCRSRAATAPRRSPSSTGSGRPECRACCMISMTSNLVLVMVHCSMVCEDLLEPRQPRRRRGVIGIGLPFRLADQIADRAPDRRLGDEIDVGVGIGLPALAFEDPARLAAAGIVAGARRRYCRTATPSPYWLYSVSGPCARRCWSRSFTRARLSTPSCMAQSTFWPRPVRMR